ncbi:MAG TPA: glycerol-3-phosphate dehydrogenase/oxidase [Candidatus Baltobacteraceae bacterium]|nr:glycerol-3-phosphate dehydrogenase/oxidase [Candidatus Baltobacteraceae bacterium]
MKRDLALARLRRERFDVLVIGGGATGLGCAVDAASRGYSTALIEAADFASATSSRSTKLIHGGVRYLQQGNIALVREALAERTRLLHNAAELVEPLAFVLPGGSPWRRLYYAAGLRLYDALARNSGVPHSRWCSAKQAQQHFPALAHHAAKNAVLYWDAQFDDARLAIALARTACDHGAAVANYVRATSFRKDAPGIRAVLATDTETGESFEVSARAVINATGIFVDELRRIDDPAIAPMLTFSRGSHIVVPGQDVQLRQSALLVPRTSDGRVLFVTPWHGAALIGTTDVPADRPLMEPQATHAEVQYLLRTVNSYLERPLSEDRIISRFAGLRPLVRGPAVPTARLSREHFISCSQSGLVSIAGGKWTTYRAMAQEAIDTAAVIAHLRPATCRTHDLRLRAVPLVPTFEEAIEQEMARRVEDVLARRLRTLFIDAAGARMQAREAASRLGAALGRGTAWQEEEITSFQRLSARYTGE